MSLQTGNVQKRFGALILEIYLIGNYKQKMVYNQCLKNPQGPSSMN